MATEKRQKDNREYYLKNKDRIKAKSISYYAKNRQKVLKRLAKKHKENPDVMRKRVSDYYHSNPEYRQKSREYSRRWIRNNPEKRKVFTRHSRIRAYGITPERYKEMLEAQGNRCEICGSKNKRQMSIDHDHETGKVRGLLCDGCNLSLGHIERHGFLEKALKYIAKYK